MNGDSSEFGNIGSDRTAAGRAIDVAELGTRLPFNCSCLTDSVYGPILGASWALPVAQKLNELLGQVLNGSRSIHEVMEALQDLQEWIVVNHPPFPPIEDMDL